MIRLFCYTFFFLLQLVFEEEKLDIDIDMKHSEISVPWFRLHPLRSVLLNVGNPKNASLLATGTKIMLNYMVKLFLNIIENKIFCTIMYYDYLGSMELTVGLLMSMAIVSYLHLKWIRWPKDRRLQMIRTGIYIIMIEAANHVEIEICFLVYQQNEVTDTQIKSCLRNKIRVTPYDKEINNKMLHYFVIF